MKFNEKLMSIRKMKGLSQEELGMELQVSRQTISKWESGQSYPDFQRLVMLSDYFDMTLDELVKDIDVQDVRNKNLTDVVEIKLSEDTFAGTDTIKLDTYSDVNGKIIKTETAKYSVKGEKIAGSYNLE